MQSKKKVIYGLIGIYRTMLQTTGNTLRLMKGIWLELILNKHKFAKGYEPNWSRERYKVVSIKGNQYLIPSIDKDKLYLRHELLKM